MTYVFMLYFVVLILGMRSDNFFYGIMLSYIIITSSVLNNVLKAITMPWKELLLTFWLLIATIYMFSLITYTFFGSDYPNDSCYSMLTCLIVNVDLTFKGAGGIGGELYQPYLAEESGITKYDTDYYRILFDNLFNFIILMLIV
jgi:inositol 1,4,5-triphosphate receptor type 3